MYKPHVKGIVFAMDSEDKVFRNKTTGEERSYRQRGIDLMIKDPVRQMVRVMIQGDEELHTGIKEDAAISIDLNSFIVEKGVPIAKALATDIKPAGKS